MGDEVSEKEEIWAEVPRPRNASLGPSSKQLASMAAAEPGCEKHPESSCRLKSKFNPSSAAHRLRHRLALHLPKCDRLLHNAHFTSGKTEAPRAV